MSDVTDRAAPGVVVRISTDLVELFPVGTVVTRSRDVLTASVPVSKPGERDRVRHIAGEAGGDMRALATRVREAFHKEHSE